MGRAGSGPLAATLVPGQSGPTGFFDNVPPSRDENGQGAPRNLPGPEFPRVAVAEPLVLTRTGEVAVAVTAIWAYATGLEFLGAGPVPPVRAGAGAGA